MLLDVGELLEASVAVGALVGLLPRVDPDVLHQLVVGGEGLEALLTLVGLHLAAVRVPVVHLHGRLVHEDLQWITPGVTTTDPLAVFMGRGEREIARLGESGRLYYLHTYC